MRKDNMSTTSFVLLSDSSFIQFRDELEKRLKALETLGNRFDALKKEMEEALNKFAEDGKKLSESVKALADAQIQTANTLKITQDEVRVIGGKLPKAPDVVPDIQEAKDELGVTMFDLFE